MSSTSYRQCYFCLDDGGTTNRIKVSYKGWALISNCYSKEVLKAIMLMIMDTPFDPTKIARYECLDSGPQETDIAPDHKTAYEHFRFKAQELQAEVTRLREESSNLDSKLQVANYNIGKVQLIKSAYSKLLRETHGYSMDQLKECITNHRANLLNLPSQTGSSK